MGHAFQPRAIEEQGTETIVRLFSAGYDDEYHGVTYSCMARIINGVKENDKAREFNPQKKRPPGICPWPLTIL